jgi:CDP-diacylglycerol---serine O-phosphatidyltransferase
MVNTNATPRRGLVVLPDLITSLGLLCGCVSIASALDARFEVSAIMIEISLACDICDGLVARASRTASPFGLEYDSLSDVVAFGVAPAILVYAWALKPLGILGVVVVGIFVICAALRLARFNIQASSTAGKTRFVGLPVPGAAVTIAGLLFGYRYFGLDSPRLLCVVMGPLTLMLAALMVSRLPYPATKSADLAAKKFRIGAALLILAALLLIAPSLTALIASVLYLISGLGLSLIGEHIGQAPTQVQPPGQAGARVD